MRFLHSSNIGEVLTMLLGVVAGGGAGVWQDTGDAIGLSLVLQVAVVELPFMNDAFSTTPLSLDDCVAPSSVVL